MYTLYHNPRCSKSREVLQLLKDAGHEPTIIDYLKHPLNKKEIKKLLTKLNLKASELIRTKEKLFQKKYKGLKFNETEWLLVLSENPVLIERPILEREHKAVIGRPIENISNFISNN